MPSPHYHAGIMRGLWQFSRTAWPWPSELPGLGPCRGGQPLDVCDDCPEDAHPMRRSTFVRYGGRPLCVAHAQARAAA